VPEEQLGAKVRVKATPAEWRAAFDRTGRTWLLHMSGGEPSHYPDFVELCETLTERHYLSLNSNLTGPSILRFAERIDPSRVSFINAGLHPEERNRRNGHAVFLRHAEALLKRVFRDLLNERHEDMAFFDERIEKGLVAKLQGIVDSEFVRMDYGEAVSILERSKEKFEFPVKWGMDLQSEHERFLTEKHAKKPVIVMNYPKAIKAFYMRSNDDGRTVAAMDVLAPGIGEIIGGSQREERLDVLDRRMDEMGLEKESYWWYRDLRRYGTVPHAGFGLGFERLVVYATGLGNIRDAIPYPRTPGSADF
jgi:aspartyl/asparaginyl-tRNA synthetase